MNVVALTYPCRHPSFEPARLTAGEIWQVGTDARQAICADPRQPKIDLALVMARSRRLAVNGLSFETHWTCDAPVLDEAERPVLGAVHHDPGCTTALIDLNPDLIGDRDDLWRSTAAHELGHAIFDVPAWIAAGAPRSRAPSEPARIHKRFESASPMARPPREMDWPEWRANVILPRVGGRG